MLRRDEDGAAGLAFPSRLDAFLARSEFGFRFRTANPVEKYNKKQSITVRCRARPPSRTSTSMPVSAARQAHESPIRPPPTTIRSALPPFRPDPLISVDTGLIVAPVACYLGLPDRVPTLTII